MPLYAFNDSWTEQNSAALQEEILRAELPQPRGFQPRAVLLCPWHNLSLVIVEIELGIEFRLPRQQLLHVRIELRFIPSSIRDSDRGALTF